MDDLEKAVLESVLAVIDDPSAGLDDGTPVVKVPIEDVMEKLKEKHGYDEDELEQPFYLELAEIMEKYRHEYWSYQKTDNDGLPAEPLSLLGLQEESIRSALGK